MMNAISCIFCGQTSHDVAITEKGFTGLRCNDCALIYISPRPSAAEITKLYTDEHAVLYADAQFQFDEFNRMEAAGTLSKIKEFRAGGSLLELGCGGGDFLAEARSERYEPYGIELNPIEAHWVNEKLHIPCENAPLSERSFGGKLFDIIYHRDVLSHLADPISVFQETNRALKADGLLVFETGNIADVRKKYLSSFLAILLSRSSVFLRGAIRKSVTRADRISMSADLQGKYFVPASPTKTLLHFKDLLMIECGGIDEITTLRRPHRRLDHEAPTTTPLSIR